jgi:hypothetical protein
MLRVYHKSLFNVSPYIENSNSNILSNLLGKVWNHRLNLSHLQRALNQAGFVTVPNGNKILHIIFNILMGNDCGY